MTTSDRNETVTIVVPHCVKCPPLAEMSSASLAAGRCPLCGGPVDGKAAARMLAARRLIDELDVADAAYPASRIPALLSGLFDPEGTGMTEAQHHCIDVVEGNLRKLGVDDVHSE